MRRRTPVMIAAAALCLAVALGGQAWGDALATGASGTATNAAVGRAASAYAAGARTFTAAVLWNRIDPLLHRYYGGVGLSDQRYMLSTLALVQALDPQFINAYYVGSWILVRNDRVAEGVDMARRGVEANPSSGLLRMNLAQVLMLYAEDLDGALEAALPALGDDIEWADGFEKHDSYAVLGSVFRAAGRADLDAIVQAEILRIDEELGDALGPGAHDHDGDGVPDH